MCTRFLFPSILAFALKAGSFLYAVSAMFTRIWRTWSYEIHSAYIYIYIYI